MEFNGIEFVIIEPKKIRKRRHKNPLIDFFYFLFYAHEHRYDFVFDETQMYVVEGKLFLTRGQYDKMIEALIVEEMKELGYL